MCILSSSLIEYDLFAVLFDMIEQLIEIVIPDFHVGGDILEVLFELVELLISNVQVFVHLHQVPGI